MNTRPTRRPRLSTLPIVIGLALSCATCLFAATPSDAQIVESFFERASLETSFYVASSDASSGETDWRKGQAPKHRSDSVEFRYWDRDFGQVYLAGGWGEWEPEPMRLDREAGYWIIAVDLDPGTHRYHFVVDEADETWTALDPGNAETERSIDHGWVSIISIGEAGRIGDLIEIERDRERRSERRRASWSHKWDDDWDWDDVDWDEDWNESWGDDDDHCGLWDRNAEGEGWLDYQRVDGWSMGIAPSFNSHHEFEPTIHTHFSYGFKSEEWSYGGTLLQPISPYRPLQLKLSGYAMTDHNEQTGICTSENSLAAIFFKDDFRDYFRREGVTFGAVFDDFGWLSWESGIRSDNYYSLENRANWSFAGGEFRINPAIDEGTMRSVFGKLRLGTRLNHIDMHYERSGPDLLEGDFDFEMFTAQIRTRLNLGHKPYIDFRLKVGKNFAGTLPVQKRYFVGGLGTVRGYPFQSLLHNDLPIESRVATEAWGGEQMLVANVEYVFDFFGDLEGLLTFDTGMAWSDRNASMDLGDLKSSAGAGIQLDDGSLRLHLAQRLDEGDHDPVVQLRVINHMF